MTHIKPDPLPEDETTPVFLGPDPHLALVHADLDAWTAAHPCECEAGCECDDAGEDDIMFQTGYDGFIA